MEIFHPDVQIEKELNKNKKRPSKELVSRFDLKGLCDGNVYVFWSKLVLTEGTTCPLKPSVPQLREN